ncbi:MAG: hypothetical protein PUP91_18160 [Rhizonema sp. PD37]|nr:hypothetical protein [Rhizonema sp. PD37]
MSARQSILLLTLSVLIALPAGIARANNDIDLLTNNNRLTITDDGEVRISSSGANGIVMTTTSSPDRQLLSGISYPDSTHSPLCHRRTFRHQSTQSNIYGTGVNRTYTYTDTTSCQ